MTQGRLFALVLLSWPLLGFLNSHTDDAYSEDPALCAAQHPEACDPEIAAALERFPYWKHRSSALGGGTHFLLGTSNGFVWGLTCNHCGSRAASWPIDDGPYAGQILDSLGYDGQRGSGAFRQFGRGDAAPAGSAHPGDLLYRLVPRPGEPLPDLPFVRILPSLDLLDADTLVLTIGHGLTGTHDTRGWFTECATEIAGGRPAAGRPACCSTNPVERWVGNYAAPQPGAPLYCVLPFHRSSTESVLVPSVCWGGEGEFASCSAAGLEYIGPAWDSSARARWHWGTTHLWRRNSFSGESNGPLAVHYNHARGPSVDYPGESLAEQGLCIEKSTHLDATRHNRRTPPSDRTKTQVMCETTSTYPTLDAILSDIRGDSGSVDFAYVAGTWYLLASGPRSGQGNPLGLSETHRDALAAWVYPSRVDDFDGDGVHNASDNCALVANGDQVDADRDGFGNACDADLDQDGLAGGTDWITLTSCVVRWFEITSRGETGPPGDVDCRESDLDGDGYVGGSDVSIFLSRFGDPPGPSSVACPNGAICDPR